MPSDFNMKTCAITLLSLLESNRKCGQPHIDRTSLVKQSFLVEHVKPLYDVWSQAFSFVRYNYGPYTEEVFYHLDVLVFNGLVDVSKFRKTAGRIEAQYTITPFGTENAANSGPAELVALTDDLVWSLQTIGVNQATKICKLVYREPEFVDVLEKDLERGLGPENRTPLRTAPDLTNRTFHHLTTISGINNLSRANSRLSARECMRVYLELLASNISS